MGIRSRRKGAKWERDVANCLSKITGRKCYRNVEETQKGNRGDVHCEPTIPLSVQCKVGAAPPILRALNEAIEAKADSSDWAVAIIRKNSTGAGLPSTDFAVLPLSDFYELLEIAATHGYLADPLVDEEEE